MTVAPSIVGVSQLEYTRFDAEFYQPSYVAQLAEWRAIAATVRVERLGKALAMPVRTGRTPKIRTLKSGEPAVRFVKTDTVRAGRIDFGASPVLPRRVVGPRDLIPNDAVLLTIIGATPDIVGRAAIVRAGDPECVTNQNVAVIATDQAALDPYFLMAYLQTSWGRGQVWRHSRRTEQVNLNCREVERILVPLPPPPVQSAVRDLVIQACNLNDESVSLYNEAQRLFDDECRIETSSDTEARSYSTGIHDVFTSGRIDADYFAPKYLALRKGITAYPRGYDPLPAVCAPIRPNFEPPLGRDQLFRYVALADINAAIGTIDGSVEARAAELPSRARRRVNAGDVLASAVVGSVDKAALVSGAQDGWIASTGFFHLRALTVSPAYLLVMMRSACVRMQFQREATGGILSAVPDDALQRIVVPRLDSSLRERITDLAMRAHAAKREAEDVLRQATNRVDRLFRH